MKFKHAQVISEWAIAVVLVAVVVVVALFAYATSMQNMLHNISGAYDKGFQKTKEANTTNP